MTILLKLLNLASLFNSNEINEADVSTAKSRKMMLNDLIHFSVHLRSQCKMYRSTRMKNIHRKDKLPWIYPTIVGNSFECSRCRHTTDDMQCAVNINVATTRNMFPFFICCLFVFLSDVTVQMNVEGILMIDPGVLIILDIWSLYTSSTLLLLIVIVDAVAFSSGFSICSIAGVALGVV